MLNRTGARRRPLTRVSYTAGLLVLLGTATALVVVARVPAHSAAHLSAPDSPSGETVVDAFPPSGDAVQGRPSPSDPPHPDPPPVSEPPGPDVPPAGRTGPSSAYPDGSRTDLGEPDAAPDPSVGPGGRDGSLADAGRRVPARNVAAGRPPGGDAGRQADLHRSLVWSGLVGLAISLIGLTIVGTRRRMW